MFYQWSQDHSVRANSFRNEKFSFEMHEGWFNEKIRSNMTDMYVLESDGIPVGQIRFEIDKGSAKINLSIDANFRGKGLGTILLRMGGSHFFKNHPETHALYGDVMNNNEPSKHAFIRVGFILAEENIVNDKKYIEFIITKHKWNSIKLE